MEEIYHAAIPLAAAARGAFVAQQCAGDMALREEVTSLLEADDGAAEFLQEPVVGLALAVLADENSRETDVSPPPPAPSADLTGMRVAGRYEIVSRIGGGGFGDVYKAVDMKIVSRAVVIKVLKEEVLRREGAERDWLVTKFQQEIEALAKIFDPGIVGIFDADTLPDGRPYIVMEFVEGSDLRQFMKRARQEHLTEEGLRFQDAAEIVRQVGRTLTAAHDAGVYHRDLKPENIMLRRSVSGNLQVKVIDFGIAKVRNSLIAASTATGLFTPGTWQYMAPEQLRGKKVDHTCDIYALGIIAYEMITGRHPFPAKDGARLKELQEAGVKVLPRDLNPDLPVDAETAIIQALSYYPAERYNRAHTFGDELARALAEDEVLVRPAPRPTVDPDASTVGKDAGNDDAGRGEPISLPPRPAPTFASWFFSRRRWLLAVAAVLLVLAGVAVWRWTISPPIQPQTELSQKQAADQGPERRLIYWLRARMPKDKSEKAFEEFDSVGKEAFKNASRISFRAKPAQAGFLYVVIEGPGPNGATKWTAVFPNPKDNEKSALLTADQTLYATEFRLDENTGSETLHVVWTPEPVRDLERLFNAVFNTPDGVFPDPPQRDALEGFFRQHAVTPSETFENGPAPRIILKGRGEILVGSVTLQHKEYK